MEGVGHEVLTFFGIWTVAVAAIILMSYHGCCCRSSRGIHPSLRREVQASSSRARDAPERSGVDTDCPICISFPDFGCLTNCGHAFCTGCFMEYFESRGQRVVVCPCCRREVNMLHEYFSQQESAAPISDPDATQARQRIASYNDRFAYRTLSWIEICRDSPVLLGRMFRDFLSNGFESLVRAGCFCRILVWVLLASVYLLSPFDLLPESVLGVVGLLDDLTVVLVVSVYVAIIYRSVLLQRSRGAGRGTEASA